jgi:hypothetical protein
MIIGKLIGNVLKAALVCACVYGIVNWESIKQQDGAAVDFAKRACVVEIGNRYDVSKVRTYEVNENNNGYVVRASVTLARGTSAKVVCLTNSHGGVNEITINER